MRGGLFGQLYLSAILSVLLALTVAGVLIVGLLTQRQENVRLRAVVARSRSVAAFLAQQVRRDPGVVDRLERAAHAAVLPVDPVTRRLRRAVKATPGRAWWVDEAGRVIVTWGDRPVGSLAHLFGSRRIREVLTGQEQRRIGSAPEFPHLALAGTPVVVGARIEGAVLWAAPIATGQILIEVLGRLLLATFLSLMAAALLYGFLSRRLLAPLRQLGAMARRVAAGDFRPGDEPQGPQEVRDLWADFERMRSELSSRIRLEQAFMANVAHELRTPLTAIRGILSAVADGTVAPARQSGYLAQGVDEIDRMRRMVDDFLLMERPGSEGAFHLNLERVDARELLLRVALTYEPALQGRGIQVGVAVGDDPLWVEADPDRLRQIFDNLMDNAVRHTHTGGRLEIRAQALGHRAVFAFENQSAPLDPDELEWVWQRFYRGGDRAGGSGLGLSIVRSLVEAHGGSVRARNGQIGPCFEVTLPIVREDAHEAENRQGGR